MSYPTIDQLTNNTRLVRLQRLAQAAQARGNTVLCKLEGDNPGGSVKDRPAMHMLKSALARGDIQPGDQLIEATSGNTGIALAMASAILGLKMRLIMPDNLSVERRAAMTAYGAELVLVTQQAGMEGARDLALRMQAEGKGKVLDQFANPDNPAAHYHSTGPELWQATGGKITHFVSSMGTTGTIMGVSQYLKEQNPAIQIIGVQPHEGESIPGIRRWPAAYVPKIFQPERVDRVIDVSAAEATQMTRALAQREGIFAGMSSGGALSAALRLAEEVEQAVIVSIVCDRGDRYLSTPLFESH